MSIIGDYPGTAFQIKKEVAPALTSVSPPAVMTGIPQTFSLVGTGLGRLGAVNFTLFPAGPTLTYGYGIGMSNPVTADGSTITVNQVSLPVGVYNVSVTVGIASDGWNWQPRGSAQPQSNPKTVTSAAPVVPNVTLSVTSNLLQITGQPLSLTNCAMIDGTPSMPQLTARILDVATGLPPLSGIGQFNLTLEFNQYWGDQTGPKGVDFYRQWNLYPQGQTSIPMHAGSPWYVPTPRVLGGKATISWYFNNVAQTPFQFCIAGYNPVPGPQLNAALDGGAYWFRRLVANHETNASQFCEPGRMQKSWCSGGYWGQPVWGYPRGYGMLQLDPPQGLGVSLLLNDDDAYEVIWNWAANLTQWDRVADQKAGPFSATPDPQDARANPHWWRQLDQYFQYNVAHPDAPIDAPTDSAEAACTFTAFAAPGGPPVTGPYSFADAILMKLFGGAPKQYISYLNLSNPPRWNLCRLNSINANIVRDFCACSSMGTDCHVPFTPPASDCATNGN